MSFAKVTANRMFIPCNAMCTHSFTCLSLHLSLSVSATCLMCVLCIYVHILLMARCWCPRSSSMAHFIYGDKVSPWTCAPHSGNAVRLRALAILLFSPSQHCNYRCDWHVGVLMRMMESYSPTLILMQQALMTKLSSKRPEFQGFF